MAAEKRARVVVVEDSEDLRDYFETLLRKDGHTVFACDNADDGFDTINRERPDLVITDIFLGVTNGLEMITRIRSDMRPPIPKIIVCSGMAGIEGEAVTRGADVFLPKPTDMATVKHAISTMLRDQTPKPELMNEGQARSRRLRRQALETARACLERLAPSRAELHKRAMWNAQMLPVYLGYGEAVVALLEDEQLRVLAASDTDRWPAGESIEERLPLCRQILETASSFVVPDLRAFVQHSPLAKDDSLGFFAGVPVAVDRTAIGAACLLDPEPRRIDAEDFALLDALGRRSSSVLGNLETELFFAPSGLVTRGGLELLLTMELERARRRGMVLHLFACSLTKPPAPLFALRTALADIGDERYLLLSTRIDTDVSRAEVTASVRRMASLEGFRAGGLVSIEPVAAPTLGTHEVQQIAESLLSRTLRGGKGAIDHVVIKCEALQAAPVAQP